MIAFVSGMLREKTLDRVLVDVNGVGYLLHVSSQTLAELPPTENKVALYCHLHVREDAMQLFGFASVAEKRCFELLILTAGVGPRLAQVILSGMSAEELAHAISSGDHRRLQRIPGIGKKTAERLVVELKDRFAKLGSVGAAMPVQSALHDQEVIEALVNLGYRRQQAERAVEEVLRRRESGDDGETLAAETLLREALAAMTEL